MVETIKDWWWAFGIVAAVFGFFVNYTRVVEWWDKRGADKKAQPKLAISIDNFSRGQTRANDTHYIPFDLEPGQVLDFSQYALISFDYKLDWHYTIHITNQTDHTAYKLTLDGSGDNNISLVADPKIEYTKPITANTHKEHTLIYRMQYRCTAAEAEALRSKPPVPKIRIEYSNLAGTRFATEFFFAEKDDDKKNVYSKVG